MTKRIQMFLLLAMCAMNLCASEKGTSHQNIMADIQKTEHVEAWERYPFLSIPLLDASFSPQIDGTVNAREWACASCTTHIFKASNGAQDEFKYIFYALYTSDSLYLAFQSYRPAGALAPAASDFTELLFDATHSHKRFLTIGLRNGGVVFQGEGPMLDRKLWTQPLEYATRATSFGWEGEVKIKFSEMPKVDNCPKPGAIWGFNLFRNELTPSDRQAMWSFVKYPGVKDFGHLVFSGLPLAFRFEEAGQDISNDRMGISCRIINLGQNPVEIKAKSSIRQANCVLSQNFIQAIDSALTEDLGAAITSTPQAEVKNALRNYKVLSNDEVVITIAPQGMKDTRLFVKDLPGSYLCGSILSIVNHDKSEKIAAGLTVAADATLPMGIVLKNYLYSSNVLEFTVDLKKVKGLDASSNIVATITEANDSKFKLVKNIANISGIPEITDFFKFKPIDKAATYILKIEVRNGTKTLAENQANLALPDKPEWINNNIGKSKFVPKPWIPLQASDKEVKTLMSSYKWDGKSIFPTVMVNNVDPLSAPMYMSFKGSDGKNLQLTLTSFKLLNKDEEEATYTFTGNIGKIAVVSGTVKAEFDGLLWYDMQLKLNERLDFAASCWSMKSDFTTLTTFGRTAEEVIGNVKVPSNDFVGKMPLGITEYPFTYHIYQGNYDGGIQWYCERQFDWSNNDLRKVIKVENDKFKGSVTEIRFVDKPVAAGKTLNWSWGFISTPGRTPAPGLDQGIFVQFGGIWPHVKPSEAELNADLKNRAKRLSYINNLNYAKAHPKDINGMIFFAGSGPTALSDEWGYPGWSVWARGKAFRELAEYMYPEVKVITFAGWGMSVDAPEWKIYGDDMTNLPLKNSGFRTYWASPLSVYPDMFLYNLKNQLVDKSHVRGIYMDSTTGMEYSNNYIIRWLDESGNVRGGYPLRAMRNFTKRIYKLFHGEVISDGIYYNHHSPQGNAMIENFTDVRCPSEFAQFYNGKFDQSFVDFFAAKNGALQFGYYGEFTNKNWMPSATKMLIQLQALAVPMNLGFKALGITNSSPNYELKSVPMLEVAQAKQWINSETAKYLPWWKNSSYLTLKPANDTLSALWLQKDKALVCVSNLLDKDRTIELDLMVESLGFTPKEAVDAINGEKYKINNGKIKLNIEFERYRLIKLY